MHKLKRLIQLQIPQKYKLDPPARIKNSDIINTKFQDEQSSPIINTRRTPSRHPRRYHLKSCTVIKNYHTSCHAIMPTTGQRS